MKKSIEDIKVNFTKRTASSSEKEILFNHLNENPGEERELIKRDIDETFMGFPNEDAPEKMVVKMMSFIRGNNRIFRYPYKIAAIILLPLIGLIIYQYIHFTGRIKDLQNFVFSENKVHPLQKGSTFEYTVNPGVKGLINLPDGSKVWLNSNSTLKCPQQFTEDKRELELSGEGYFQVVTNPMWPLYIKTSSGYMVKVTGTEFNLSSYSNDSVLKLTMVSGKVKLINVNDKSEIEIDNHQEVVLPVNKEVKQAEIGRANVHLNTGWKNGLLIFDNTPMEEVIKKMERWFGVNIEIKDTLVLDNRFTGEFESESLIQVLEFMKVTSNVRFSVKEKTYTLFIK